MPASLLPTGATAFEIAAALAGDPTIAAAQGAGAIALAKLVIRPPSFLPFLVWEYGLGELTPYVPNVYDLIDQGVAWQRVRGTPDAIARGLDWLDYTASLEEADTLRAFWNSFQLRFDELPASDDPDLERIAGVTGLSVPVRSHLRRGVFAYDVSALSTDTSRYGEALYERESGVAHTPGGTLWSFGRTHEINHVLTEAEGTALGNWTPIIETEPAIVDLADHAPGVVTVEYGDEGWTLFVRATLATAVAGVWAYAIDFQHTDTARVVCARDAAGEARLVVVADGLIVADMAAGAWAEGTARTFGVAMRADGSARIEVDGVAPTEWADALNGPAGGAAFTPPEGDDLDGTIDRLAMFGRGLTASEFDDGFSQAVADAATIAVAIEDSDGLTWSEATLPWEDAVFPWQSGYRYQRSISMASWFMARSAHVAFRGSGGEIIGYRCARARRQVAQEFDGAYRVAGETYAPAAQGGRVYIEAMTDFGDGTGAEIAEVSLIIGADVAPGIPPGRLWLGPDEITGGVEIALTAAAFPLRPTVRDAVKFLLRF